MHVRNEINDNIKNNLKGNIAIENSQVTSVNTSEKIIDLSLNHQSWQSIAAILADVVISPWNILIGALLI